VTPRARRRRGQTRSAALEAHPGLARQLQAAGARRRRKLADADAELERIADLAGEAQAAGANLAEIAELAGVSRPTLYRLLGHR